MNRKTKIIGTAMIVLIIILAVIGFVVSKKTGEAKMEDTKNLAMYVPYGDGQYVMVDQKSGGVYTVTMPEAIYDKDGEKITAGDLKKGNIVAIYGNGIMLQSYPGQYPGVTKIEVVEEGKETDADQYQEIIDEIYQEPNPADRPAINIEYRTQSAIVSSTATEGSFNWSYTDAEGKEHADSNDASHILTWEELIDMSIDKESTDFSLTFTSAPNTVEIVRWPVGLRDSNADTGSLMSGETVEVKEEGGTYVVSNIEPDYVYQVTATWDNGTVAYGFYTK